MHALLELIFSFLKVNDMEAVIWFLFNACSASRIGEGG